MSEPTDKMLDDIKNRREEIEAEVYDEEAVADDPCQDDGFGDY